TWFARGAEAYRQQLRSVLEVADDVVLHEDDVVCLGPDALLTRRTNSGTVRGSGGHYERVFLWLRIFGPDGRISRIEFFYSHREHEALARFDALTGEPATALAPVAPLRAAPRRKRRVHPNAATANAARWEAAIDAHDADTLPSLIADDAEFVEHVTG